MKHALNSPSRLARRYQCPGSAALQAIISDNGLITAQSDFADEGTRKHEAVKQWIEEGIGAPEKITDDVAFCVKQAQNILSDLRNGGAGFRAMCEYPIALDSLGIDVPGTADFLAVVPGNKAWLIDWKFGVIKAENPKYNWQLKAYAVGVQKSFGVKEVEAAIVQPNLDDEDDFVRSYCFWQNELEKAAEDIRAIIAATKEPDAPLVRGDECRFCGCKEVCPAWKDCLLEIPKHLSIVNHLETISPDARGKLVDNLLAAKSWIDSTFKICEDRFLKGDLEITGYEKSQATRRKWAGTEKDIIDALCHIIVDREKQEEIKPSDIFHPAELISPSEFERMVGKSKAVKEALAPLIVNVPGSLSMKKLK